MPSTPRSLLDRLRQPADSPTVAADWASNVQLFTPLMFAWARRARPTLPTALACIAARFGHGYNHPHFAELDHPAW